MIIDDENNHSVSSVLTQSDMDWTHRRDLIGSGEITRTQITEAEVEGVILSLELEKFGRVSAMRYCPVSFFQKVWFLHCTVQPRRETLFYLRTYYFHIRLFFFSFLCCLRNIRFLELCSPCITRKGTTGFHVYKKSVDCRKLTMTYNPADYEQPPLTV